ncbi:MAG: aminoacyl-tRNA hydrolase [Steroidobacteraceae bacterium]|nr:aminoacyl-tRNA hydrolase [Steroidobacteraceae bacterium]
MAIAPDDIPADEVSFTWVRSPGPGGQNVNKVSTACEMRFTVGRTRLLDEPAKERLRRLAGRRLTLLDEIVIEAHRHRSQEGNRRDAMERLATLLSQAAVAPKPRKKTRPTKASKERRLDSKKKTQRTKQLRGRTSNWD